ncbi:hypothetical protein NPIL_575821 [Nephila pilipes]|uniref:Uncharacterized protein n=1 Tax=Nephila pilipes TaxID=299642 RepID=A0A8X6QFF7_NEPPI|nr:hypothetical protein NPIL_575821 [Nephila pilipes]
MRKAHPRHLLLYYADDLVHIPPLLYDLLSNKVFTSRIEGVGGGRRKIFTPSSSGRSPKGVLANIKKACCLPSSHSVFVFEFYATPFSSFIRTLMQKSQRLAHTIQGPRE